MQCLDHTKATDGSPRTLKELISDVQQNGRARFFYSNNFAEWIMLVPHEKAKNAVHCYYGKGVAVYTLAEVEQITQLPKEARQDVNEFIRDFGAFVSDAQFTA